MRFVFVLIACLLPFAPASAQSDDIVYFRTPSNNIHCMAWNDPAPYIRCDILQINREPGPTRDCPIEEGLWGHTLMVENEGSGQMICTNDAVVTSESWVLGYGKTFSYGNITCTSARDGLTCENGDGGGFQLSREWQEAY